MVAQIVSQVYYCLCNDIILQSLTNDSMKTAEYVIETQLTLRPVSAPTQLGGIRACPILLLK